MEGGREGVAGRGGWGRDRVDRMLRYVLWYKSTPGVRPPLKFHSSTASAKPCKKPKQTHGAWADPRRAPAKYLS